MGAGASSQWQGDPAISGSGALTSSGKEQGLTPAGPQLSRNGSTKQDKSDTGKDARWCARVKRYVEQQYGPEIKASLVTAGSNEKGQAERFTTLAKNYVNFWLEAADLEDCPDSAFRALRTDDICDRYFRIGGKFKIPFNKLVVEEVLMARDSDSVLPKDVFAKAMLEAKEYLDAEVLPFFYSSNSKLGYRAVKNNPSLLDSTNGSAGSSSGLDELNANDELVDWLEDDPKHPFEFRAYLSASQPEMVHYLDFLLESYDFAMLYLAGNEEGLEEESAVLVHFNDLFDRYLMLGNEVRSELPADIVSEMLTRARSEDELDGAILDEARIFAQSALLPAFARHRRELGNSLLHSTLRALEFVAADRRELPDLDRIETLLKNEAKCRELQEYVGAREPATLMSYAVEFCVAVAEFEKMVNEARQSRTDQSAIIQSQAFKVFEEYLKHQAPKEMGMITGEARREVLRGLRCPKSRMFAGCRELAVRGMATSGVCGRFYSQEAGISAPGGHFHPYMARNSSVEDDEHDVPLSLILRRHEFCRNFKRWAEQEFLLVPIQFWFETNEFLRLPHADLLLSRCRKIMRMYVVEGAPRRFNLTPEVILSIQKSTSIPGPAMFVDAQREAYNFMETQMMPRFRHTGQYKLIRMSFMVDDLDSGIGGLGGAPVSPKEGALGQGAEQGEDTRNDPAAFANTEVPNTTVGSQMSLKNCLHNPLATRFFLEFCISRQHGETVMFWIEANDFKAHVPGKRFMVLQARKIYNKYMGDGAKKKVKLSVETQEKIAKGLESPQKNLFAEAQEEAYQSLQSELYPAFLTSPQFEELLELARYETVWDTIKRRVGLVFDPSNFRRNSLLGGLGQNKTSFTLPGRWSIASSPHPSEEAHSPVTSPAAAAADVSQTLPATVKRPSMINQFRSHLSTAPQSLTSGGRSPNGSYGPGESAAKAGDASSLPRIRLSLARRDSAPTAPGGT